MVLHVYASLLRSALSAFTLRYVLVCASCTLPALKWKSNEFKKAVILKRRFCQLLRFMPMKSKQKQQKKKTFELQMTK